MIRIHNLGLQEYVPVWQAMQTFTRDRTPETADELWLVEHLPVYTQGQAGKPEHILKTTAIPVIQTDRGGQVTYHGPGQMVAYVLMNIQKRNMGARTLVCALEDLLIHTLAHWGMRAHKQCGAPGVFVEDKKIASIGLRVKNGCTFHGIALNVDMDLSPFSYINPCGFHTLEMTHMKYYFPHIALPAVQDYFSEQFLQHFQ